VMVMEHESIPMGIEGLIQEWASEVVWYGWFPTEIRIVAADGWVLQRSQRRVSSKQEKGWRYRKVLKINNITFGLSPFELVHASIRRWAFFGCRVCSSATRSRASWIWPSANARSSFCWFLCNFMYLNTHRRCSSESFFPNLFKRLRPLLQISHLAKWPSSRGCTF
jgi:hypothetical protein